VTASNPRADLGRLDALSDRGVDEPRAVQMQAQVELVSGFCKRFSSSSGHARPPDELCVFSTETSRVIGMCPLRQSRIEARTCSGVKRPFAAGQRAHHESESAAGAPCSLIMTCAFLLG